MTTFLPKDASNHPIPVMRLRNPGGAHAIDATDESARNSAAFAAATCVVSLYATVPVFIRFGGSDVTANASDHYLPAGVCCDLSVGGGDTGQTAYVSAIRAGDEDGVLYVSERE